MQVVVPYGDRKPTPDNTQDGSGDDGRHDDHVPADFFDHEQTAPFRCVPLPHRLFCPFRLLMLHPAGVGIIAQHRAAFEGIQAAAAEKQEKDQLRGKPEPEKPRGG